MVCRLCRSVQRRTRPPPCHQANVEGALAAGIPAVHFKSAAQLEEELRQRGFRL